MVASLEADEHGGSFVEVRMERRRRRLVRSRHRLMMLVGFVVRVEFAVGGWWLGLVFRNAWHSCREQNDKVAGTSLNEWRNPSGEL